MQQKITDIHTLKEKAYSFPLWKAKKGNNVIASGLDSSSSFDLLCEFMRDSKEYDTIILSSAKTTKTLTNVSWANGFMYHRQLDVSEPKTAPQPQQQPANQLKFGEIMTFVSQLSNSTATQVDTAIKSTKAVNDQMMDFQKMVYENQISDLKELIENLKSENEILKFENDDFKSNEVSTTDKIISGLKEAIGSGMLGGNAAGGVAGIEEEENEDLEFLYDNDENFDGVLSVLVKMLSSNRDVYNKLFHPSKVENND